MKGPSGKRILLVDDSATIRMFIALILKKTLSPAITEAVDGVDAFEKLQKEDFDLVLTDMIMPGMDGAQLIEKIRGSPKKNVPIIIITTKGEEKDRDRGIALGANGYITKPVNVDELKETVLKCLMACEVGDVKA